MAHIGNDNGQDVELNLAPIIDAFTVLIAFMLVSASFLSIGILDAGIAASGETSKKTTPPPINIDISVNHANEIFIQVSGKTKKKVKVKAASDGNPNFERYQSELQSLKKSWPKQTAVTLTAKNSVQYKEIVRVMNATRKTHPNVLLGGF